RPERERGRDLEDAAGGEPDGSLVGRVPGGVDLSDVDSANPAVEPGEECSLNHLGGGQAAGEAGRASRRDGAIADVEVEVDVDRAVAGAGDVERLAEAVLDAAAGDVGPADDRDAEASGLVGVRTAV